MSRYLLHVLVAFGGRRENAGDVQRLEAGFLDLLFGLHGLEQGVIFDGVVDRGRGQNGIEFAPIGGGIVLGQNGFDDGFLGQRLARLGHVFSFGLVIVHVEAQDVAVFDGVGDGVGVQLLLEDVLRGFVRRLLAFDLLVAGVLVEDRRAGEAEQLGVGEELLDGLVVLAELRAVAFVEDEHHALVP